MGEKVNVAKDAQVSPGRRLASRLPRLGQAKRKQDPDLLSRQNTRSKDTDLLNTNSTPEQNHRKAGKGEEFHWETLSLTTREKQDLGRKASPSPHRSVVTNNSAASTSRKDRPNSGTETPSPSPLQTPTKIKSPSVVSKIRAAAGSGISSSNSKTKCLGDSTPPRKFPLQRSPETNRPTDMESFAEVAAAPPPQDAPHTSTEKTGSENPNLGAPLKDDSFIKIDESTIGQNDGQKEAKELPNSSTKGNGKGTSKPTKEDALGHPDHDNSSYAEALKTGLTNGDNSNGLDDKDVKEKASKERNRPVQDDESDPDLDDSGLEEVYQAQKTRNKNGSIRWAPWNVPFRRRAQTFVVLLHCLSIVGTVSLFFALCANPFAWPLLLIYLLHLLTSKAATDGSLAYRWEWFRQNYFWHLFAEYFPARLHKTCDLPPTRKYIFGYHPHGIISHGAWAAFATDALGFSEKFPGITNSLLTLDSNFRVPIYRDYILAMGVRSVSKESIINILTKGGSNGEGMGRGVTVVVGGARESLEAQPGNLRLILRERKGFVKIAVRTGADLVPVLCFGENELYDQLPPDKHPLVHQLQMFVLKVWKFTLPFMHGRGIFNYDVGLMPYRHPLNIVVGAPIKVEQSATVDQDYIDRLHGLYVDELVQLWERYKDEFASERHGELEFLS